MQLKTDAETGNPMSKALGAIREEHRRARKSIAIMKNYNKL